MRQSLAAFALASALVAGAAGLSALYAEDSHSSGSTMGRGMMGQGGMMSRGGMMGHCGSMMQGGDSGRPNDQWRRRAPAPEDDG